MNAQNTLGISIPFKSQVYSKTVVPLFSRLGYGALDKEKFFPENCNLPNVSMKMVSKLRVSDGVYTLFKKTFFVFDTALLKCFVFSRVGILDYPCCSNPCGAYQELGQGDFYSFNQKFIYYLPTKNVTARKTILTSILSIAFVTEWTSIGL